MILRSVTREDIPACLAIYNYYVQNSDVTFDIASRSLSSFLRTYETVIESYPWIVAEEAGKILGYACLSAYNPKAAYRYTADVTVYLDPKERGRGIGSRLMKRLEEIAEENHILTLISLVTESNRESIRMHERLGYQKYAVLKNAGYKNGTWLSTVFFEKRIGTFDQEPADIENRRVLEVVV
ncbi:MAG: N-acetyltransferase [Solobacterium sp.]|nr:N-acetyltransferase [Solobacterium sp.]